VIPDDHGRIQPVSRDAEALRSGARRLAAAGAE
jgi:hypothetical protein